MPLKLNFEGARSRRDALERAARARSEQRPGPEREDGSSQRPQRVCIGSKHLSVSVDGDKGECSKLSIPLLFCDVVQVTCKTGIRNTDARHVVALAPRQHLQETSGAPDELSGRDTLANIEDDTVWLLCIGGHNDVALQRVLFEFGIHGGIRWDLASNYDVGKKPLGEGGQATVYLGKALHPWSALKPDYEESEVIYNSTVAVKKFKVNSSIGSMMPRGVCPEVKCLHASRGHPNILKMISLFCSLEEKPSPSLHYALVTQLCTSGDLFDCLNKSPVSESQAVELMVCLLSAVAHLHSLRIVHRDVKAENILLIGPRPLLADFGVAGDMDDTQDMARSVGTPGYAAPEMVCHGPKTAKVDIFSLGVLLYYALFNRMPFSAAEPERVMQLTVRCKIKYPSGCISSQMAAFLHGLLRKDPRTRPSAHRACLALWQSSASQQNSVLLEEAYRALPRLPRKPAASTLPSPMASHSESDGASHSHSGAGTSRAATGSSSDPPVKLRTLVNAPDPHVEARAPERQRTGRWWLTAQSLGKLAFPFRNTWKQSASKGLQDKPAGGFDDAVIPQDEPASNDETRKHPEVQARPPASRRPPRLPIRRSLQQPAIVQLEA